ncbi:hypothetical protein Tco_1286033 [Tanacetum coccineum]
MANTPVSEMPGDPSSKLSRKKLEDPGQLSSSRVVPALQSTRMTLELANCSLCVPKGITRDVLVPTKKTHSIPRESNAEKSVIFPTSWSFFPFEGSEMILKEEIDEVEFLERKTKEDFETKDEPKKKKELQVFHPDIETFNHFETTSYVGNDYVFYEDFNLVDMIFPMNVQGKIFDPGITFHEKSFEKDAFKDKSSKELAPSKALLTLDVFDPLHPPLMDFHVTKAFSGFTFSLLKFFSKKFFEPGIKNAMVYLLYLVWGGKDKKDKKKKNQSKTDKKRKRQDKSEDGKSNLKAGSARYNKERKQIKAKDQ